MGLEAMKSLKGKKIDTRTKPQVKHEITEESFESTGIWNVTPNINKFDYSLLDDEERKDFQEYENKLNIILNTSNLAVGKVLSEANEKYANAKNGVFGKWVASTGIGIRTAERLVKFYRYWDTLPDLERKTLESIPITLAYAITSKSAEEELVAKVMSGEIKTNVVYKEKLAKLKEEKEIKEAHRIEEEAIEEAQIVEKEVLEAVSIEGGDKGEAKSNKYIILLAKKSELTKELREFESEIKGIKHEIEEIEDEMEKLNNVKLFQDEC